MGIGELVVASLTGLPPFLAYFIPALILIQLFMWVYTKMTPHDEVALIKDNNMAASTVYVGALAGFALPMASVIANSVSLIDFAVWAIVAGVAQLLTFLVFRRFYPKVSERIEAGEMAVPLKLAATSVMVGLINASAITY